MTEQTKIDLIAKITHEVNRDYCISIGDDSQVPWDDAPEWQKASARAGVKAVVDNPDITHEQSHENWLAIKRSEGWTYGLVKDASFKRHPCCVPYAELPPAQKEKDKLFVETVRVLGCMLSASRFLAKYISIGLLAVLFWGCTDNDGAMRALEGAGYTDIELDGYDWLLCGGGGGYKTSFTATGPTGKRVSGAVCSGVVAKGSTIRLR